MRPLLICCSNMVSKPAGRAWPNTAASSSTAGNRASGANGREPRRHQCPCHAAKCARCGRNNPAGHAATAPVGEQCSPAGKGKFRIRIARTAHCQRENDESRRSRRTRRFPEIRKRPQAVTNAYAAASARSSRLPLASVWPACRVIIRSRRRERSLFIASFIVRQMAD